MDLLNIMAEMCSQHWNSSLTRVFYIIGTVINFIKILVPILLILFGSIDLMKAVMASKDDEIKKAQSTLIKRAIYAVVIFFIPAIANLLIGIVNPNYEEDENYNCVRCVLDTGSCPANVDGN